MSELEGPAPRKRAGDTLSQVILEADGLCRDYRIAAWPRRTVLAAAKDISLQLGERNQTSSR